MLKKQIVQLAVDLRIICAVLLLIIAGMLLAWQPWSTQALNDSRVITVTGESKITTEPDEFVFYPSYEFKNADKSAALSELTKKSDEITAKLKTLGVPDSKIKTNTDSYGSVYKNGTESNEYAYNLRFTITLPSRSEAQKIQDYLVTTSPVGTVSPQATFSDAKRKEIENKARDEATRDARAKADQSARNLGFKVGKVKSISDASFPGGEIRPMMGIAADSSAREAKSTALAVQPGENDLTYSVTVTYYIR
jgi:uncharacterized protein